MDLLRVDPASPDPAAVARAGAVLRGGGLVAFPTETVYGLGGNALDEGAVRRIFAAKGRPADNPLIVHIGEWRALATVAAAVPPLAARLAEQFWPGPLTLVVDAAPAVPAVTRGGLSTVAVRMPDHPVALALLEAAGVPVAAPSANRSGRPSPTTAAHVAADLGDAVDVLVDGGPCRVGVESTVVDARGEAPIVLRQGAVSIEELLPAGSVPPPSPAELAASPGTRYRHYAPGCRVEIAPAGGGPERAAALAAGGHSVGLVATAPAEPPVRTLATFDDAETLARVLYEALRASEDVGVDVVVVEGVPERGIGRAVMDRLRRAAAG
jgi:L-threonylcarbamoyladenylate synthase